MNSKIMPYILPLASIVLISITALLFRPQVTGFFIASPQLNAEIKITADEILPENAEIHIFLEKDNTTVKEISTSTVNEFVDKFSAQKNLQYINGKTSQLNYGGFGYLGADIFNINIDTSNLKKGSYILKTQIIWQNKVVSETQQEVQI